MFRVICESKSRDFIAEKQRSWRICEDDLKARDEPHTILVTDAGQMKEEPETDLVSTHQFLAGYDY